MYFTRDSKPKRSLPLFAVTLINLIVYSPTSFQQSKGEEKRGNLFFLPFFLSSFRSLPPFLSLQKSSKTNGRRALSHSLDFPGNLLSLHFAFFNLQLSFPCNHLSLVARSWLLRAFLSVCFVSPCDLSINQYSFRSRFGFPTFSFPPFFFDQADMNLMHSRLNRV